MICMKKMFDDMCENCKNKYIIIADLESDDSVYFCFDTESECRLAYDYAEKFGMIDSVRIVPKSAIMMVPKNDVS